jgi:hypothetical protein
MGLPMRYPRTLIVLLVALVLAGWSAGAARSLTADAVAGVGARTAAPTVNRAVPQDPAQRVVVVDALAVEIALDRDEAGRVLDAMTESVLAIAEAGARAGVLTAPAPGSLMDAALEVAVAADPTIAQAAARAAFLSSRADAVVDRRRLPEPAAIRLDGGVFEDAASDPIQRWVPLVERYFPSELVTEALAIIDCESGGDPSARNPRSSAAGLFQFIDGTWEYASEQAGFAGAAPDDPEANVAAAAWLVEYSLGVGDGPWAHWTCRP